MTAYLKARRRVIAAFVVFAAVIAVVYTLGGVPLGATGYAGAICGSLALAAGIVDYIRFNRKRSTLEKLREQITISCSDLPEPDNAIEHGYSELIGILFRSLGDTQAHSERKLAEMADYYTMWAHQIKTPISSMRLSLAEQDSPESRELTEELVRIEQYVEMVLCYIRLESSDTDYVIRECSLDSIVRAAVRRFSGQFIRKKLTLDLQPTEYTVLTDEKWLLFVVEQVLSNALKYTRETPQSTQDSAEKDRITISFENETLCIADTGIGIAPEDLPRVFERGFTGCNGRTDMKASGIGLYLCKRICTALGHTISIQSGGDGTRVYIGLSRSTTDLRD